MNSSSSSPCEQSPTTQTCSLSSIHRLSKHPPSRNWVRASPAPTLPGIGSGHPRPPLYQELGQGIPGPHFTRNWVRASPAPTLPGIGSGHPRPPLYQSAVVNYQEFYIKKNNGNLAQNSPPPPPLSPRLA